MKIYVASSWRNNLQPEVVTALREAGHEVYDFKNPPNNSGFGWEQIHEDWQSWTNEQYKEALLHPVAEQGFAADFDGMNWADVCVLVLPCGRSAHTEAGFMAGEGKPVIVLTMENEEPELMYKIYNHISTSIPDVLAQINLLSLDTYDLRPGYRIIESEGLARIADERFEQLTKHNRSLAHDIKHNGDGCLIFAASKLLQGNKPHAPGDWDKNIWRKMINKPYEERLIIAGALLAAEYDRVTNKNQ